MSYSDIVIIGSGIGGAIAAARLSEAVRQQGLGASIRVVERGHDYFDFDPKTVWTYRNAQGNGFRQTVEPDYYSQLLNIYSDLAPGVSPTFSVLGGNGIGGGSLVYLGIKLRAPSVVFEQTDDDGARLWPEGFTRAALDPYYQRIERVLRVTRLRWTGEAGARDLCTRRDLVFAQGCLRIGATAEPLKIACQDDTGEGWWSTGQRFPGRQHLPLNYLRTARDNGVHFDSDCEVRWIAPSGNGYVVAYTDQRSGSEETLECRLLLVAGGAVGSTGLLLRSSDRFQGARALSDHLGFHISGNGDYGVAGIVGKGFVVDGHKGKPMASVCASFWNDHQFLLTPFFAPAMPMAFGQPVELAYPDDPGATGRRSIRPATTRLWGDGYKATLSDFGPRLMTMAALALDRCEGQASVDGATGKTQVAWPTTHPDTERRWSVAVTKMRAIYNALGGEILTDAYRYRGHVISPHPLGGCRMAASKDRGVVDPGGEVFDNPNLFVVDAATVPSALGVHPSLTVAAVAERACEQLGATLAQRLS
jgi:choline dehydrogenase-like flavoprotein